MSEFDVISRYFTRRTQHTDLAVGDDAALVTIGPGMQMAVSADMLVSGIHFFADTAPFELGWKAAAVNISDMAAMAAVPRWITLSIALPHIETAWLERFSEGFASCCETFDVDWIGGDTTRGPLNIAPTIFGEVPVGQAVLRSGARAGDDIWVSGSPGRAALGLRFLQGRVELAEPWRERCLDALRRPQPRVALGVALRGVASAMLDISDGLVGDLQHILECSQVGAILVEALLPLQDALAACGNRVLGQDCLLAGGDDYELLFCAAADDRARIEHLAHELAVPLTRIGAMIAADDKNVLYIQRLSGATERLDTKGFDHFPQA